VSVVVVGANHRSAPLDLLELMTVDRSNLPKALSALAGAEHISESVILSTCNRTEVYLVAEKFHGAFDEARNFFSDLTFLPPERFSDALYVHHDADAVRHLFEVAAGLDSAVPGEHEVLGQLRLAWDVAREEGICGRQLNSLFRHAVEVGKRARTETAIAQGVTSVPQAAVVLAAEALGTLQGRDVLLVGAGSMGRSVGGFLLDADVRSLTVVNRSVDAAAALVASLETEEPTRGTSPAACRADNLSALEDLLAEVEVVVTATSSPRAVVTVEMIERSRAAASADLVVVDIGLPRDVEPASGDLPGVTLLDLHSVTALTDLSLAERHREVSAVRRIVAEEVERFAAVARAREFDPVVRALRDHFESIRSEEVGRTANRLTPEQFEFVDGVTRAILAKLLHEPTVSLKRTAGTSLGDRLAESVRDLFGLGADASVTPAAAAAPDADGDSGPDDSHSGPAQPS